MTSPRATSGINRIAIPILLFAIGCARGAESPFDAAQTAMANVQLARARDLFREAQKTEKDPVRRDKAAIALARIEWRAYHNAPAARRALTLVDAGGEQFANALIERARLEWELNRDLGAARTAASRAVKAAVAQAGRSHAIAIQTFIEIDAARRLRLAGRCTDAAPLRAPIANLRALIAHDGPRIEALQLLLDAALMTGDRTTAIEAWRLYYGSAPAVETADRRAIGLALANAKFFTEAELVLRDPCERTIAAADPLASDIVAYASSLRRIRELTDEYYRKVAIAAGDAEAFRKALDDEGRALWSALSFPAARTVYTQKALIAEIDRRFGAVITLGNTGVSSIFISGIA
jgi:hypothetical protein